MNILIGKIGKSVKFKNLDLRKGGDSIVIFYSTLSRMFPEHNFYFAGPNQLSKLSKEEYEYIFPNKNVFSAHSKGYDSTIKYLNDKNINIDFAIIMMGMVSAYNIPNYIPGKNGEYPKLLMWVQNYAAPYINALNELNCPLYLISEDARYITCNAKDLYNRERIIFSQINREFETAPHIKSKDDKEEIISKINAIYSGCEKIFMMGIDKDWKSKIDLERKINSEGNHFIVLSNGCGSKKINAGATNKSFRLPVYKKWILDNFKNTPYENTKIYGVWEDTTYNNYPQIEDKPMYELTDEIADAKYTFVYSIMPGFVTVKAWEMIIQGLIPFMHPEYDENRLLGLPEYCYVKDEQELLNKIIELDNNPELYKKVFNECLDCITPNDLNGSTFINFIMNTIYKDLNIEYTERDGVESIFNRFSKNMF